MLRFSLKCVFGILVLFCFSLRSVEEKQIQNPLSDFNSTYDVVSQGAFAAQAGFYSSIGFGRVGQESIKGGYTDIFVSVEVSTPRIWGFDVGVGFSGLELLHTISSDDIYSNVNTDETGVGFRINNDEAKDFRYISQPAILHTLYLGYQNSWGNIKIGRFPLKMDWIGDFVQGIGVNISKFGLTIQTGWFDSQAYAGSEENVDFGSTKKWYEKYEGFQIKNNYYFDVLYKNDWIAINSYYNHFDTLLDAIGLRGNKTFTLDEWHFDTEAIYVFIASSVQSPKACSDPIKSQNAGLGCYVKGSMGKLKGYLWGLEQKLAWQEWKFTMGYIQNDRKNSTNNLPIYADNNPLEYNSVVYGGGAKTGYIGLEYVFDKRVLAGVTYGMSYYEQMDINEITQTNAFQGQLNIISKVKFKSANLKIAYTYINDSIGYENNIVTMVLGYDF